MSAFTADEIDYLAGQRLARIATARDGTPHVVPVTFRYDPEQESIDVGGHNFAQSKKWRDVGGDDRVAIVVDDVLPPWRPRCVEVRGRAERLETGGTGIHEDFDDAMIRIRPTRIISWGLVESESFQANARDVERS